MTVQINIFNQYYFGFLKKVKDIARELKHSSTSENPKNPDLVHNQVLKAIKNSYASYDILSNEYHEWFINNEQLQNAYKLWNEKVKTNKDLESWLDESNIKSCELYKEITVGNILEILNKKHLLYYYVAILYIFSQDITETELPQIIQLIKNLKDKDVFEKDISQLENENIRTTLQVLMEIQQDTIINSFESSFKELEDTSLGKLAKEIMSDINLEDIQNSLQQENDLMKALSNPDGGLTKLLGSVSQKMISKMASGEIKQETLLKEAMTFSSQLKNLVPTEDSAQQGMFNGLGDIGSMLEQFQKMTNGGEGLGNIEEMMNAMGMGQRQQRNQRQGNRTHTRIDNNKLNRVIQAKQLRHKLEKKKQQKTNSSKENVQTHVEDEQQ